MIKSICKILVVSYMLLVVSQTAIAKTALDLGIAGVGARPLGMGKAYVAVADDANALFLNPAGIALSKEWKATSMSTRLLETVDYKHAGGIIPTAYGTFGIGYIGVSSPAGYLTTDKASLSSAAEISYGSSELLFSYAREIGNTQAGASLKLLSSSFSGYAGSASGYALDLGVLSRIKDDLTVGANLQNVISSLSWGDTAETLGSVLKFGVAGKPADKRVLIAIDADMAIGASRPVNLHAGVEVKPYEILTLRAGLDQDPLDSTTNTTNLTAGVGVAMENITFDYAYHQDSNLAGNSTHYFSLSISAPQVKEQKVAEVTSSENQKGLVLDAGQRDILSYYK